MNGYSKMEGNGKSSPRSVDQSSPDHSPLPQPPNPTPNNQLEPANPTNNVGEHDPLPEQEDNREGITSGPKLRRNSSVSSAYALQAAVNRAFSMRRSSSVSERYCRIHDQSVTLKPVPFDEEQEEAEDVAGAARSGEKKKKRSRGKILKAWKKLFGL